jgi:hypothetical protein
MQAHFELVSASLAKSYFGSKSRIIVKLRNKPCNLAIAKDALRRYTPSTSLEHTCVSNYKTIMSLVTHVRMLSICAL